VAQEVGCNIGEDVGYTIRFEDVTSPSTRIKFLTDGLLLREALIDPLLSRYSVIMVDEAHERSLSTDILLGILKKILKKRPELRIIISSATIQAEKFIAFFESGQTLMADNVGLVCAISLEGRAFPVDTLHLEDPTEDYIESTVSTVMDIHTKEPVGDILVFLTGRDEIDRVIAMITHRQLERQSSHPELLTLPLYAGLSTEQQLYVFEPTPENTRKVIVATNIAEASVTIDGIVYVIDCGFVKLRTYDPRSGIEALVVSPVSKASAVQRAGRAGRVRAGKCFRLYTEAAFQTLNESSVPEIQRSNLSSTILQLKALGVDNVAKFDFITPPPSELIVRGLELLYSLEALDEYARLARPLGIHMAELSVEPMMAKCLLASRQFGCTSEMLAIAAMVSQGGSIWIVHEDEKRAFELARRKFAAEEGDHITLLNVYSAFTTKGRKDARWCRDNHLNFKSMQKAVSVRAQLRRYLEKFDIKVPETVVATASASAEQICRCLTAGYFAQTARMQPDGSFRTINGTNLFAHPSSLMFVSPCLCPTKSDWKLS
jgi:ATP-dependent RNA helicase DDX35